MTTTIDEAFLQNVLVLMVSLFFSQNSWNGSNSSAKNSSLGNHGESDISD